MNASSNGFEYGKQKPVMTYGTNLGPINMRVVAGLKIQLKPILKVQTYIFSVLLTPLPNTVHTITKPMQKTNYCKHVRFNI